MSVTVSGIMINPVGEPVVNAQITLTAVANSLTVLNTFSVTVRTDNTGAYRIQLEEGSYSITVAVNGRSFVYGAVTLDNTTGPSTLNQLLKQQIMESELTPDVILYFRQIQQQVANDLATIKVLENSASNSAISAGHSRDEAGQYATELSAALATAKGYRDQSGISANAAALSQQKSATSESKAKASEDSASLSEQHTLAYRNAAQLAAATAADDASTLAAEQTAAKITLAVKTDADRAVDARTASEQIKAAVDSSAQQVAQQLNEATQAASAAKSSKESAATSEGNAFNSATAANNSKVASVASAETARQNAVATTIDQVAAKGFRDEAEEFAEQARVSAESIDMSTLEQQISQKVDKTTFNDAIAGKASNQALTDGLAGKLDTTGGTLTGSLILVGDAIDDMEPVTKQQFESKSGIPLGMSWFHDSRDHLPEGTAAKDGQLLSRALFPDMWAELAAGLRPMIDDATWLANPHARASFSSGDGSTTFRLPDWNGKSVGSWAAGVPRGDGLNSTGIPGNMQADAIRNITGAFSSDLGGRVWLGATATSGVFSSASSQPSNIFQPNDGTFSRVTANGSFTIDASRQVPTASENRMVNFTGVWVIKLAGGALNEGQINALELATQITALSSRLGILEADAFTNAKMVNTPWINLTLGGGWSGSVYRYRKVLGMVQLQVSIAKTGVTSGEVVTTLPVGYRPTAITQTVVFAAFTSPTGGGATYPARIIFNTDGTMALHQSGSTTELNFVFMFPIQ
ncbi:TPA: prophage tail fiber N-terminal domain-containing protein [Yersinia enterocolitica]|nr:prophage tail fiber N-terminal domain-containing protein [Yersinia enterocolitica]